MSTEPITSIKAIKAPSAGEIAYTKVAFLMVEYPLRVVSTHQVKNRKEHKELIAKAKTKGLYLYYADVKCVDGKYYAVRPWVVDWETMPDHPDDVAKRELQQTEEKELEAPTSLICPYCSKQMSSTSGLTLHIKSKHLDKLDRYQSISADEDDVIDRMSEVETEVENDLETDLKCPYCSKQMSSTSGRTLHVKSKHPDRFQEYFQEYMRTISD